MRLRLMDWLAIALLLACVPLAVRWWDVVAFLEPGTYAIVFLLLSLLWFYFRHLRPMMRPDAPPFPYARYRVLKRIDIFASFVFRSLWCLWAIYILVEFIVERLGWFLPELWTSLTDYMIIPSWMLLIAFAFLDNILSKMLVSSDICYRLQSNPAGADERRHATNPSIYVEKR